MRIKHFVAALAACTFLTACSDVPSGHVGVKVHKYGGSKGVDVEELSPGRYFINPWSEDFFVFPTFTQTDTWAKTSKVDESITFQTKEGLTVNADVGITYNIIPNKVPQIFQRYRKGIEEISDLYLRNIVRDALVNSASVRPIDSVYGQGKSEIIDEVEKKVREQVGPLGINIESVYLLGEMRLPATVVTALNSKIEATQKAQQRENEVAQAKAEAQKFIEAARGEADSILLRAQAQAKANEILSKSITKELTQYKSIEKWDGVLPRMTGSQAVPFVKVD